MREVRNILRMGDVAPMPVEEVWRNIGVGGGLVGHHTHATVQEGGVSMLNADKNDTDRGGPRFLALHVSCPIVPPPPFPVIITALPRPVPSSPSHPIVGPVPPSHPTCHDPGCRRDGVRLKVRQEGRVAVARHSGVVASSHQREWW